MTEIEYTRFPENVACYDPETDIIFLNTKLLKNKKAHDRVLEHEQLHAKAKKNYLEHLYIDLTDNFKHIFDKESIEFMESCHSQSSYKGTINNILINIILMPFAFIARIYFLYLNIVKRNKED